MKKILIVCRGIPSDKDPMWGNFELDQAKAIHEMNNKVVCISIDRRIRFYWRKLGVSHVVVDGIPTYNFYFPLPYFILPRFLHNFFVDCFTKVLYNYVIKREGRFNIIHGHYLPNIRIATKLKELMGVPVVGTEHWSA